ncbi:MAG: hypothetical protein ACHQFZ_05420 [Acidimicrobiales bacterium]
MSFVQLISVRRASLVFGVIAAAVGAWALRHVRDSIAVCTPRPGGGGFGLSSGCLHEVWLEYVAFALILAGLFAAGFAVLLMQRRRGGVREIDQPELRLLGTPGEDLALRRRVALRLGIAMNDDEALAPGVLLHLPDPAESRAQPDTRRVS